MSVPDAVLARIVASVPGGVLVSTVSTQTFTEEQVPVYDGIIPDTPPARYVIVYIDIGTLDALAACGRHDSVTVRWQTTSVADDGGKARWVAERTRDSVDTTPVSPGWVCGPIQHVYSQRPQRDETVAARPVVYQIDQYELLASKA